MKKDLPGSFEEFYCKAKKYGFKIYSGVTKQNHAAISLDEPGPVLRYFMPELRPLPEGTQIGGVVGIALRADDTRDPIYDVDVFHNILNLSGMVGAARIVENDESLVEFFSLLEGHLDELPGDVDSILKSVASGHGWISQQFKWNDPELEPFKRRLTVLQ